MLHTHTHTHTHARMCARAYIHTDIYVIHTHIHHFLNITNNSMHYLQSISGDEEMVDWGFHFH
jgi:hypothetical protein